MTLQGAGTARLLIVFASVSALVGAPAVATGWSHDGADPVAAPDAKSPVSTATQAGTWSTNVKINNEQTGSVQQVPGVAMDGKGVVYAGWAEDSGSGKNIYVSKSTDWGMTWTRGGRVNPTADQAGAGMQRQPRLALAPNGDLLVAWHFWPGAGQDTSLYVSRSTDGGATFPSPVVIDIQGDMMNVAVQSTGLVHGFNLYGKNAVGAGPHHRTSGDGGLTWSAPKNISTSAASDGCECCHVTPVIAANDDIYLTWRAGSTSDKRNAVFTKSSDRGMTWGPIVRVSDWDWGTSVCPMSGPELAEDAQGGLHLVFMDPRTGDKDLYYYKSADKGATWSAAVKVNSQTAGDQDQAAVAVVGNEIVVAWMQNDAIWWSKSTDGTAWSAQQRLEDDPAGAHQFPVAASLPGANAAVFAWSDSRSGAFDAYGATYYGANDTQAPTVQVTAPANGASLGGVVNVDVDATDNVAVARVEFHLDGVKKGEDTTSPYRYSWDTTTAADGAHKLKAAAFDVAGNSQAHEIDVTVSNQGVDTTPPSVTLTSPTNGAIVNGQVTITADATDNKGVASVLFFVDGTAILNDSTAPYQAPWDTTQAAQGAHALKATAVDTSANTADVTVTVTVDNQAKDTLPPVVTITFPTDAQKVSGPITVRSDITDNVGVKDAVLLVDGNQVGAAKTAAPWEWPIDTTAYTNADHSIEIMATDAAGNPGTKKIVAKFDNQVLDAPPSVSIMEPSDGATLTGTVRVQAMASDDRGLKHVEFKLGDVTMRRPTQAPWEWEFDTTTVANGQYTIEAIAEDFAGQVSNASITVTVGNKGGGGGGLAEGGLFGNLLYLGLIITAAALAALGVAAAVAKKRRRANDQLPPPQ